MTFIPVVYISPKSGTRVRREDRKAGFFRFANGSLTLRTQEEVDELDRIISKFSGSSVGLVRRIDPNKAVQIAKQHKAKMLQMKNVVVQGVVTATHRAEQISEVTTSLKKTEASHLGISLKNPSALGGADGQTGVLTDRDIQNPGIGEIENAIASTAKQAEVKAEPVAMKLNLGKKVT